MSFLCWQNVHSCTYKLHLFGSWNISINNESNEKEYKDDDMNLEAKAAREIMKESAEFLEKSVLDDPDKEVPKIAFSCTEK